MGKRSHTAKRAGLQERRPDAGRNPAARGKSDRRILWAATLLLGAAGLTVVGLSCLVLAHRPPANPACSIVDDRRSPEVEELIRRYFRTWSSQDMKGYGECFLENSTIQFIPSQGKVQQFALSEFLAYQADVLSRGPRETEVPLSLDIRFEAELARVVVYWKLTAGPTEVFGYDHFTMIKRNGKWGIVNLVFYETQR